MHKTILTQTLLIALLTAICITNVYSQKGKKVLSVNANNNVQINSKLDSLYANYDNDIEIKIPTPYNIYGITVSQGSIRNNDDSAKNISGLNILSDLKTGTVTITIYKNNLVFKQRTFGVREKIFPDYVRYINSNMAIQPEITLAGITNGGYIKKQNLLLSNKLVINSPFKILKYTLSLQPHHLEVISLNSTYFDKFTKEVFEMYNLNSDRTLMISDIYVEDKDGNIFRYAQTLYFKIVV